MAILSGQAGTPAPLGWRNGIGVHSKDAETGGVEQGGRRRCSAGRQPTSSTGPKARWRAAGGHRGLLLARPVRPFCANLTVRPLSLERAFH